MKRATGFLISVFCFQLGFAQIGGPATGTVGQTGSYTYHDMTTYPTFSWTVTGGANGTVTSSTRVGLNYIGVIQWNSSGTANVNFIGNGNLLGTMSVTVTCPAVAAPNATFNYPNGTSACGSVLINYSASPPAGVTWYWQTTSTGTSQANSSNAYTATTSQTYYLRGYSSGCWGSSISTAGVTVLPLPQDPNLTASLTASTNTCGPKTITLTGTPPSGETWNWQGTDPGGTSINQSSTYLAYTSGTYYLRALKTNNGCWGNSASKAVTINDPLQPTPAPTTTTYSCGPQTLTRSTPPSGETWYWQDTNSNGVSTANSSVSYTANSSGTYYLRSQNSLGCWSQSLASVVVTVQPFPSATISGTGATICGPGSASISAVPGSGANTIHWYGTSLGGAVSWTGTSYTTPSETSTTPFY